MPEKLPENVIVALQPYFSDLALHNVKIKHRIPWFVFNNPLAFALHRTLYFRPGCFQPNTIQGLALIAHELTHIQQYKRYGTVRMSVRYLAEFMLNYFKNGFNRYQAYRAISFEVDARAVADRVLNDLEERNKLLMA